jgi:hypothetical protein
LTTPDESPAAISFGKGKRYFGVCGLMASIPGLSLIGHGQFEGFSEQYGMDFARPLQNEITDTQFIEDHHRLITPLLNQRFRFTDSRNLKMYDFIDAKSKLDENVYVFFNKVNSFRSLIVFNNQDKKVSGKIKRSSRIYKSKSTELSQALENKKRDPVTLKEIRFGDEKQLSVEMLRTTGLELHLKPYDFFVFDVS